MTSLSFSRSVCCSASRRTHTLAAFVPSCFNNKGKTLNKLSPFSCCFLLLGAKLNGRVSAVKLGGRGLILHRISSWQLSVTLGNWNWMFRPPNDSYGWTRHHCLRGQRTNLRRTKFTCWRILNYYPDFRSNTAEMRLWIQCVLIFCSF